MPAPSNQTPGTAIDLGTAPASYTIVAADLNLASDMTGFTSNCKASNPQRKAVWFKYTTGAMERMFAIGIDSFTSSSYKPIVNIWTGTPPTMTQYRISAPGGGFASQYCDALVQSGTGLWFEVAAQASTTYYIQVQQDVAGTADQDLTVRVTTAPTVSVSSGTIFISDDVGLPGAMLNASGIQRYIYDFPSGNIGIVNQTTRYVAFQYKASGNGWFRIFDPTYINGDANAAAVATVNSGFTQLDRLVTDHVDRWYAMRATGSTCTIKVYSQSGSLLSTHTIANGDIYHILPLRDQRTLLYMDFNSAAIHSFDLQTDTSNADFAADVAGTSPDDGAEFDDGTIGIVYYKSGNDDFYLYSAAGAVIASGTIGFNVHRWSLDSNRQSFWVWDGGSGFAHYTMPTLTSDTSFTLNRVSAFSGGPQVFDFMFSDSCPLMVVGGVPIPTPPTTPTPIFVSSTPSCCATGGSTTTGPVLPAIGPGWTPSCAGGGVPPTASDLSLAEAWDY